MKKRLVIRRVIAVLIFLFNFSIISKLEASTWYINPPNGGDGTGSDATGTGSLINPWLTIQAAINNASVLDGDILVVMNGITEEYITINKQVTIQSQNGSVNTKVKVTNTNYWGFKITSNNVSINGIYVEGPNGGYANEGIWLNGVTNCNISNNTCTGFYRGINISSSNNNTISSNTCNSNYYQGIDCSGTSTNNTVSNNTCNSNLSDGIRSNSSATNSFSNNLTNSNTATGIYISGPGSLTNNTCNSNSQYGIRIRNSANPTLRGNKIENNVSYGIYIDGIIGVFTPNPDLGANNISDKGRNTIRNNNSGLVQLYMDNSSGNINAYYNYWGTDVESEIEALVYHKNDNSSLGQVSFMPCLSSDQSLPVQLTAFTGNYINGVVLLNWQTATEINNYGFQIESKIIHQLVEEEWREIGFLPGHGNSNSPNEYSFIDQEIRSGTIYYRLKQIDFDGSYEYSKQVKIIIDDPVQYSLFQNYPNPFNPVTKIKFCLPTKALTKLTVYDVLGREIEALLFAELFAGYYEVEFNGKNYPSGIYYYKIQADHYSLVKKMILMK